MLELGARFRPSRSLRSRALALGLLAVVGWSSIEVLWDQIGPASATTAVAAADDQSYPDDDCPCFCACACQAVHVVLPTPQEPGPDRLAHAFEPIAVAVAPPDRPVDPPYRPPRPLG